MDVGPDEPGLDLVVQQDAELAPNPEQASARRVDRDAEVLGDRAVPQPALVSEREQLPIEIAESRHRIGQVGHG